MDNLKNAFLMMSKENDIYIDGDIFYFIDDNINRYGMINENDYTIYKLNEYNECSKELKENDIIDYIINDQKFIKNISDVKIENIEQEVIYKII
tara:strand:+ start:55 stop:336 length:282 start_codon:yes stop_codon:yes gene_type:complete